MTTNYRERRKLDFPSVSLGAFPGGTWPLFSTAEKNDAQFNLLLTHYVETVIHGDIVSLGGLAALGPPGHFAGEWGSGLNAAKGRQRRIHSLYPTTVESKGKRVMSLRHHQSSGWGSYSSRILPLAFGLKEHLRSLSFYYEKKKEKMRINKTK